MADGATADRPSASAAADRSTVDPTLKRRLEEAYLNDEADVLVVTAVWSVRDGDEVVVEFRPPHGDATHTERFDGPSNGSLAACPDLLAFLAAVGVSPLDLDDLVGSRVPATFDPDAGWCIDDAYVPRSGTGAGAEAGSQGSEPDGTESDGSQRAGSLSQGAVGWLRTYRDWLIAIGFVGFELLLVVVLIVRFA